MTGIKTCSFASISAAVLLGLTLAGSPVMAGKGGNGGGNGGGHAGGNGGSHAAHSETRGKSLGTAKSAKSATLLSRKQTTHKSAAKAPAMKFGAVSKDKSQGKTASSLGKLNGFLHASDQALSNTSRNLVIGKVLYGYGDLLGAYLAPPVEGAVPPTAGELAAALAAAANKPLTAEVIAVINARLLSCSQTLADNLAASGKTAEDLSKEIAAAL